MSTRVLLVHRKYGNFDYHNNKMVEVSTQTYSRNLSYVRTDSAPNEPKEIPR